MKGTTVEFTIKLGAALPKGDDLNGFADSVLAETLCSTIAEGRSVQPQTALIIFDVKKIEVGADGEHIAHLRIRRAQPVQTSEGRRTAEVLLRDEYAAKHGDMVPFDLQSLSKAAFGDLPRETDEIDEREEAERQRMSPGDELRRHLVRVHGRDDAELLTDGEAEHRHTADHDGELPGELDHDVEWIGWTRSDIEAATAESDDENSDERTGDPGGDDGTPTNDELEGPDPDLGRDLDDEDDEDDEGRAGSPHESSDADQVSNVTEVNFSSRNA